MGFRSRLLGIAGEVVGAAADALRDAADPGGPEIIAKADTGTEGSTAMAKIPSDKELENPKSLFFDPYALVEQLGYKERPSQITYGTLRAMVFKMPIINAIIQTRINQIASFGRVQHDRYDMGFRIKLRDPKAKPSKGSEKFTEEMETLMLHGGVTHDPLGRDSFETFLKKLSRDSLIYDQMCFEKVPDRRGLPANWYAIDSATIRIADTASAYYQPAQRQDVKYVQIYDGMVITEYSPDEMCFGVRNPTTDIRNYGYGTSELEMLVTAVTALLWSWEYNAKFFTQGSSAKGILNFKGTIPEKQLKAFRRHWYTMIAGVSGAWRTPVTNTDDKGGLEWIDVQKTNRDMEFNAWMDFLIKVVCSLYQMDPVEVNFKYGNTGQKSAMQDSFNREKITESKERGLRPILRFIAGCLNRHIIWQYDEDFEFEFVGLDAATQDETADLNAKRVKTIRTIDELRAEDDLDPLPDGMGEVILDPNWMQMHTQKQQMEQQAEMGFDQGFGGDGGFGGDQQDGGNGPGKKNDNPNMDFGNLFGDQGPGEKGGGPAQSAKPAKAATAGKGEETKKSLHAVTIDIEL